MSTVTRRMLATGLGVAALGAVGSAAAQPNDYADVSRAQQRLTAAMTFVPMPRLAAPVLSRTGTSGTLVAEVCLDVPNETLRNRARAYRPRLRAALRQALSTYGSVHMRPGGAPDADALARMLQVAVDQSLGARGARLLMVDLMLQQS